MSVELLPRHLRSDVADALGESRAVAVLGARQVGKSTLVAQIARDDHPARLVTLDDPATAGAAREDPTGFVASLTGPVAIDEIQRVPELLLAIKRRLDADDARGQFLLTGSANLLSLPTVADALPGRIDYLTLWPLSRGELDDVRETFIDDMFAARFPQVHGAPVGRAALAPSLVAGGYPDVRRRSARGRARFFDSYVSTILGRDLPDVATVRSPESVDRLLSLIAAHAGGIANFSELGRDLGLNANTVHAHVAILEALFLVRRLPPWHTNLGSRHIKSPKLHLADTGLLCHLIGADEERIVEDGDVAGRTLETFVVMELTKQAGWASHRVGLFHYRDQRQREVDVVLERPDGAVVGVEVKAGATPTAGDFTGLKHLRDRLGDRFRAGVVLHTGADTVPFGERLVAVPLSGLRSGAGPPAAMPIEAPPGPGRRPIWGDLGGSMGPEFDAPVHDFEHDR